MKIKVHNVHVWWNEGTAGKLCLWYVTKELRGRTLHIGIRRSFRVVGSQDIGSAMTYGLGPLLLLVLD